MENEVPDKFKQHIKMVLTEFTVVTLQRKCFYNTLLGTLPDCFKAKMTANLLTILLDFVEIHNK